MAFTFAILTDLHYGDPGPLAERRGELAAVLLQRTVERLNRFVKPHLVVVLGDLLNHPEVERATEDLHELRSILDGLACPYLAIPGNHDFAPAQFYDVMPEPEAITQIDDVRLLCFADREEPGCHARRTEADLVRLRSARHDGFSGSLVTLQHVPVMPRGQELIYSYTNLDDVLAASTEARVTLNLGGHCHQNSGLVHADGTYHLAVEALCESPHAYALVTLASDGSIQMERQSLAMPTAYGLIDLHSHTQMAYCAGDVHVNRSPVIAEAMGLRGLAFTEHSGHLYFSSEDFWSGRASATGIAGVRDEDERVTDYFALARSATSQLPLLLGMEVDTDFTGSPVIHPAHRAELEWAVGAVHFIPAEAQDSQAAFVAAFQRLTEGICASGIDVLAHPFRIFRREQRDVPATLYPWLVDVLRRTGVAAEINFHTNEPHPTFVQMCLESGVRLTFGSDAHELWEVGEFFGHLKLLERLGVSGDPTPFLLTPQCLAALLKP
ncbi:metallophosphoesterase [Phycisphaerales bacterium AB-hyl4]|uniref:Metallophosphoesterase n=1 Tax=Natronomicrosphaera hydrolytica TaxID=3242702 RepID=A0ABV4U8N3_9BACT